MKEVATEVDQEGIPLPVTAKVVQLEEETIVTETVEEVVEEVAAEVPEQVVLALEDVVVAPAEEPKQQNL